jgi:hypothetical protein
MTNAPNTVLVITPMTANYINIRYPKANKYLKLILICSITTKQIKNGN